MELGPSNFAFLKPHDIQLVRLGALAERYFHDDPNTCLIKVRQFGELLAQLIAGKTGLLQPVEESQADLLRRLKFERLLPFPSRRSFPRDPHPWKSRQSRSRRHHG